MPPLLSLPISAGKLLALLSLAVLVLRNVRAGRAPLHLPAWEWAFGLAGLCLVTDGVWLGLVDAPRERMMGDAGRILYVHVPSATAAYIGCFLTTAGSILYLWRRSRWWELVAFAGAEVATLFTVVTTNPEYWFVPLNSRS